jgi:hypothetical protein
MVRRTRFDPLHDATTEQQLFDSLPALARNVALSGGGTAILSTDAGQIEVALSRDQFARAAEPVYRVIASLLHELRPAGAPLALVVPQPVAELPGLREELEQFAGCELVVVCEGFAAAATSLLALPERKPGDPVRLLRRLPVQKPEASAGTVSRTSLDKRRSGGPVPSHVLLDGRAYSLNADSLVVGRAATEARASATWGNQRSVTLVAGLAGVSRRHCTFVLEGSELLLLDHSTFGTFVNGERVAERIGVHAGDRVKIGEPGVELELIAVGDVAAIN